MHLHIPEIVFVRYVDFALYDYMRYTPREHSNAVRRHIAFL